MGFALEASDRRIAVVIGVPVPISELASIIVAAASDQVRNAAFLVGSAHPTKASIPARGQACENGNLQREAARKRDPPGRHNDQGGKRSRTAM